MAARVASFAPTGTSKLLEFILPNSGKPGVPSSLLGWSVTESTGSAKAQIRLHDGENSSAPILASQINLAQGESIRDWFGDESIEIVSGKVYLEVISGSVEGAIYW